jgi:hypothetical protein
MLRKQEKQQARVALAGEVEQARETFQEEAWMLDLLKQNVN